MTIPSDLIHNIFGKLDEHIKTIEQAFKVSIVSRNDAIHIVPATPGGKVEEARQVLTHLVKLAQRKETITPQHVNYAIASLMELRSELKSATASTKAPAHPQNGGDKSSPSSPNTPLQEVEALTGDTICNTISGRPIKPKTVGQKKYIDQIRHNTIVFAIGPAGTGKTYLAMAMAITAFRLGQVNKIILTRPAIEAGEKLGFLPGDLQQKVDPYLRPLYDALNDIMGAETFQKNFERGLIEVAPLAYMRGRTLDNSFIVLDEAQNTTPEQMKMFLTRLGNNSKAVITGDITQIDLPYGQHSGLTDATKILKDIPDIGVSTLTAKDVVRHPLVQKIINAYDKQSARDTYKKLRASRPTRPHRPGDTHGTGHGGTHKRRLVFSKRSGQ